MSRAVLCIVFGFIAFVSARFPFGPHRFGPHRRSPPCGLPPFIDVIPAEEQEKIREIWKDYKKGDKCYMEQGLTREVLFSLPKEVIRKIHRSFLPGPLMKAPKEVQEQFRKIFEDRTISFKDKPKKIYDLAQKLLTGDLLKEFNEFHKKMEEHRKHMIEKMEEHRKKIEEMMGKLSPEAKEAHKKMKELDKQKHEIMAKLSKSARHELIMLWKERRFPRPHHKEHKA